MLVGLIGAGNMGGAILRGAFRCNFLKPYECIIYDVNDRQTTSFSAQYPVKVALNNTQVMRESDCVILAVKPVFMQGVLDEIVKYTHNKRLISIAAGWTTAMLREALGKDNTVQILRVMPNTPALVSSGFTVLCEENSFSKPMLDWAKELFSTLGVVKVLPERLFDAALAVSGSGPVYAYMLIEAMADGAVKYGMPRSLAIQAAAQTLLGSAKMVLDTGEHPAQLKDNVCSPGGTTIEAVEVLEQRGFRGAVLAAMDACVEKNSRLVSSTNGDASRRK